MKIGAHVSASGGVLTAFDRAHQIGANCLQIFVSSPRMWKVPALTPEIVTAFQQRLDKEFWSPSFVHIKYLVNICSPNGETVARSLDALVAELTLAAQLGLYGGMFHIGAPQQTDRSEAIDQVVVGVKTVLKKIPQSVKILLENSASQKKLGASLEEIKVILDKIDNPNVEVCLDTAHAFASGNDLSTESGVKEWVEDIDRVIDLDRIAVIHTNDSKGALNSGRDLHENIGLGLIGEHGFRALIQHPKLQSKPFILEVPGLDGQGPDKANIDILKGFV